jgi:DNA mismatch endonuclease (patch repair protein)
MSMIRGVNTKPEIIVRSFLHKQGLRFSLHSKTLPGKPDIVLPKYRTVVFVHGCFWHGHSRCKYFRLPQSRVNFWRNKIIGNKLRDRKKANKLIGDGWQVITIWECELRNTNKKIKVLRFVEYHIRKNLSKNTKSGVKKSLYKI